MLFEVVLVEIIFCSAEKLREFSTTIFPLLLLWRDKVRLVHVHARELTYLFVQCNPKCQIPRVISIKVTVVHRPIFPGSMRIVVRSRGSLPRLHWNLRTTVKLSYWVSEVDGFDVLVDLLLSKQHITVIFLNVCEENSYDCEAIKFLEDLCCARNIIRQDIGRCRGQTTSKLLKFISDDKAVERLCPGCYLVCRHEHAVVLADADYGYWCSINELMFSATVQVEVTNKDQSHHDCKNNLALSVVHTLPGASDEDWVEPCTFHTKGGALKVEETFLTAVADDVMTQGSRFLLGFFGDALSILPDFLQMTNAQVGENIFVPWFIKEFNESGAMVGRRVPCPFPLMAFVFGPHGGYTCPDLRDAPHWESMSQISHMRVAPPVDQHNNVILDTVDATEFIRKLGSARSAWRGVEAILDDTSKHATVACELQKVFQMDAEEMPAVAGADATFMSWTPTDWDQGHPLREMAWPTSALDNEVPWAQANQRLGNIKMKHCATPWAGSYATPPEMDREGGTPWSWTRSGKGGPGNR